MIDLLAQLIY